jgi:RNA recognition motif-containing protein
MTKLFVVGFPRETSEIGLDELFTTHAMVRSITIIRDMQTGESKGYAFVDMMDAAGAERAIRALDGMAFGSRVMSVRFAEQKVREDPLKGNSLNASSGTRSSNNRARRNPLQAPYNRTKRPRN